MFKIAFTIGDTCFWSFSGAIVVPFQRYQIFHAQHIWILLATKMIGVSKTCNSNPSRCERGIHIIAHSSLKFTSTSSWWNNNRLRISFWKLKAFLVKTSPDSTATIVCINVLDKSLGYPDLSIYWSSIPSYWKIWRVLFMQL